MDSSTLDWKTRPLDPAALLVDQVKQARAAWPDVDVDVVRFTASVAARTGDVNQLAAPLELGNEGGDVGKHNDQADAPAMARATPA